MIQSIHAWLSAFPGLEALKPEQLEAKNGAAGLFCRGQTVLRRTADILGGQTLRRRLSLTLALHTASTSTPQALLDLETLALPTAPVLGRDQTVSVTQGRLVKDSGHGLRRYEAQITFEYTSEV